MKAATFLSLLVIAMLAACTGFDVPDSYPSGVIDGTEFTAEPFRLEPGTEPYRRDEARQFNISGDLTAQHHLQQCLPGTVVMEFMVAPDGRPVNVRILESQPPGAYDHVAFLALRDSRFEPVIEDGVWQPVRQKRPVTFDVPDHCR